MRIEFVEAKNKLDALDKCPWACWVMKVEGGYRCYESFTDFMQTMRQI